MPLFIETSLSIDAENDTIILPYKKTRKTIQLFKNMQVLITNL